MKNKLPLIQYVEAQEPKLRLTGYSLIACQHLLSTTVDLIQSLLDRGMSPKDIFILGKCYSSNRVIYRKLKKLGVYVSASSFSFESHRPFDNQHKKHVQELLSFSKKRLRTKKVIVLDDGGELLRAILHQKWKHQIVGVEQTTSGFEKLKGVRLAFPIVNVARSKAKLQVESPFIAEAVLKRFFAYQKTTKQKILVVGNGPIGKNVALRLRKKHKVVTYDSLKNKEDFPGKLKNKFNDFSVIFGATGKSIMPPTLLKEIDHPVTLVSVSSSDREFSAVWLRKQVPRYSNCHRDLSVGNIKLLNSGFPINFDGSLASVPAHKIQLTRALLIAGVFQAVQSPKGGLQELDQKIQTKILRKFNSILR